MNAYPFELENFIRQELDQDCAYLDVTGNLINLEENRRVRAIIRAKEAGVFAGAEVVSAFFAVVKPLSWHGLVSNGSRILPGDAVLEFRASLKEALCWERTLLNFLTHLSGVATLTAQFVEKVAPYGVQILATRKTLPGLKNLQLSAVQAGGGKIHRRNLSDGILIKENHQTFVSSEKLLGRANSVHSPLHRVEIEVQSFDGLVAVLKQGADVVMLDNFSLSDVAKSIPYVREHYSTKIEISGGVTLSTIQSLAELRPDYISVGALTHSAKALDLSLDVEETTT